MALTLFAIQKAKPCKLSDGNGLHLSIEVNGSGLWRFRYQFDRKEKMLSLGSFPDAWLIPGSLARISSHESSAGIIGGQDSPAALLP
jgi:hypothetical protein